MKVNLLKLFLRSLLIAAIAAALYIGLQFIFDLDVSMYALFITIACMIPIIRYIIQENYRANLDNKFIFVIVEIVLAIILYNVIWITVVLIVGSIVGFR